MLESARSRLNRYHNPALLAGLTLSASVMGPMAVAKAQTSGTTSPPPATTPATVPPKVERQLNAHIQRDVARLARQVFRLSQSTSPYVTYEHWNGGDNGQEASLGVMIAAPDGFSSKPAAYDLFIEAPTKPHHIHQLDLKKAQSVSMSEGQTLSDTPEAVTYSYASLILTEDIQRGSWISESYNLEPPTNTYPEVNLAATTAPQANELLLNYDREAGVLKVAEQFIRDANERKPTGDMPLVFQPVPGSATIPLKGGG